MRRNPSPGIGPSLSRVAKPRRRGRSITKFSTMHVVHAGPSSMGEEYNGWYHNPEPHRYTRRSPSAVWVIIRPALPSPAPGLTIPPVYMLHVRIPNHSGRRALQKTEEVFHLDYDMT